MIIKKMLLLDPKVEISSFLCLAFFLFSPEAIAKAVGRDVQSRPLITCKAAVCCWLSSVYVQEKDNNLCQASKHLSLQRAFCSFI